MTNQIADHVDVLEESVTTPDGLRSGASRLLRSWRTAGILIPFLVLFVVLSITSQPFLHTSNLINILDQRVWNPNPQFFTYSLSKAALWMATRTMAQGLAPRIRVNGIGPGPTLPSIHQTPEMFQAEAEHTPLQRRTTPADIAAAALYLIDAPTVTGQMIAVDGGQHLIWQTPDVGVKE